MKHRNKNSLNKTNASRAIGKKHTNEMYVTPHVSTAFKRHLREECKQPLSTRVSVEM